VKRWLALPILSALVIVLPAAGATESFSVAGGEGTRALTFVAKGVDETAKLVVIVRSDSAGTLKLRFIDKDGNEEEITSKGGSLTANTDAVNIKLLAPSSLNIGDHDAVQLQILFLRDARAKDPVSGNLIVSLMGDSPAGPVVVPVTITKKASAAQLQFNQDKSTISLTRLLGPFGGLAADCTRCVVGESADVNTRGTTPATKTATIHSESGGNATVKLERKNGTSSKLSVTKINRHGSYEGKLVLDPDAEKPRSLAIDVKARDFIFWPLFFIVVVGGGIGAFVLKRYENRRNRGLVQALIKSSVDPYLVARNGAQGKTQRPERFYLEDLLSDNDADAYPKKGACGNADALRPVPRLYCKAGKLNGGQSLDNLLPEVTDVSARFDRWHKVEEALTTLLAQVDALPAGQRYNPMRNDARALLVRSYLEPDDDKVASELVLLFHEEAAATTAYVHARNLYDAQPEPWQRVHTNVDPNRLLDALPNPATRTSANAKELALVLLYLCEALKDPAAIPEDPRPDDQTARIDELRETLGERTVMENLSEPAQRTYRASRQLGPDNVDTRTPQQIRAGVRRSDWAIFWITAVLTALVYLAGQYSDDWGSAEDYIFAVAAGAVAPSVITWSLIPFSRSYKPPAAAAAPAGGA
jgi:hypothetical protein